MGFDLFDRINFIQIFFIIQSRLYEQNSKSRCEYVFVCGSVIRNEFAVCGFFLYFVFCNHNFMFIHNAWKAPECGRILFLCINFYFFKVSFFLNGIENENKNGFL